MIIAQFCAAATPPERAGAQICAAAIKNYITLEVNMNRGKTVSSNPEFLLKMMDELPSDDDFDGYLTEEEEEGYSSTQKNTGNKIMINFFVKIKIHVMNDNLDFF